VCQQYLYNFANSSLLIGFLSKYSNLKFPWLCCTLGFYNKDCVKR
jgi:hypothetical protein